MNGELEVVKRTKTLGTLIVKPVEKQVAKEMIVKNHYSHKWNDGGFGKYNFGVFLQGFDECLGVAVYGLMKNPKAQIFNHPNPKSWMCELNRMWIDDRLGKNAETVLIAASIKLLKRMDQDCVAVQSFADGRLGCGTIYKAANFDYYGHHYTKFIKNKRTGEMIHEQQFTNSTSPGMYLRNNVIYLCGDTETFQVKTYRYIYPLCKHFEFTLKKKKPYPPYEKGIAPVKWNRNHTAIAGKMVELIYKLV